MKPCTHVWGRKILWLQIKNLLPWLIVFPFKGTPLGNALRDMSLSTWEINPGIMGRQSGWCNEPGNYKACPNEAVTSFLCLHKHSAWNVIRVGIHTFFVLPVWERSMHGQRSRALRCASLADTPIPPGVLSQWGHSGSLSPGHWSHCCQGTAKAAVLGFTNRSVSGVRDGNSLISAFTCHV